MATDHKGRRIVGCCRIVCSHCPVFKATRNDSTQQRSKILEHQRRKWAAIFTEQYGRDFDQSTSTAMAAQGKANGSSGIAENAQ